MDGDKWDAQARREQRLERQFLQDLQLRHQAPDGIDTWAAGLLVVAGVLTPLLVGAALYLCWRGLAETGRAPDQWWFYQVPALAVAVSMVLSLLPKGSTSRWIRLATLLPFLHLGLFPLVGWLWHLYLARLGGPPSRLPLIEQLPAPAIALALGLLVLVCSLVVATRRPHTGTPRWLHSITVFALLHLLLLGLWLPMASAGWGQLLEHQWIGRNLLVPASNVATFTWVALAPPTAVALLLTLVLALWPKRFARRAAELTAVGVMLFTIALLLRSGATFEAFIGYANFVHVLLSQALFCLFCIASLALSHWRSVRVVRNDADRPAPWVQRGVVESTGISPVGWVEYLGWLGGLRMQLRAFALRTESGELEVPAHSALIAPMPAWTASANAGERVSLLSASDEVTVSGFVAPAGDSGPYRQARRPVPGTDGMVVTTARGERETVLRDVMLIVWRPCVFYLLVATAAAIPGVVALTTF